MKSWCWQRNVTSAKHVLWLAACSFVALAVSPVSEVRAEDLVTIELVGEIDPKCRLSALPAGIELGQISASGTQTMSFQIDCNTPFEYGISSRDGALKNGEGPQPGMGFANQIPYMLEIRIPTDEALILEQCDSESLSGATPSCGQGNSGSATAINQTASLMISWAVTSELVAGIYSDIVTLTFRPRV
jgi:hypothetical protein